MSKLFWDNNPLTPIDGGKTPVEIEIDVTTNEANRTVCHAKLQTADVAAAEAVGVVPIHG